MTKRRGDGHLRHRPRHDLLGIAYVDDTARRPWSSNAIGDETTPSVVYFETPTTWWSAGRRRSRPCSTPTTSVSLIKRQMGTRRRAGVPRPGLHPGDDLRAHPARSSRRTPSRPTRRAGRTWSSPCRPTSAVGEREATADAGRVAGLNVLTSCPSRSPRPALRRHRRGRGPDHPGLRPRRRHVRHHRHPDQRPTSHAWCAPTATTAWAARTGTSGSVTCSCKFAAEQPRPERGRRPRSSCRRCATRPRR